MLVVAALGCASPDGASNRAPVANAGRDLRVLWSGGVTWVELDGLASYDPDRDPIGWRWSVVQAPGDAQPFESASDGAAVPVVPIRRPGLHVFALRVTDGEIESAPDFVNVWAARGRAPSDAESSRPPPPDSNVDAVDIGPADAGAPRSDSDVDAVNIGSDGGDVNAVNIGSDGGDVDAVNIAIEPSDGGDVDAVDIGADGGDVDAVNIEPPDAAPPPAPPPPGPNQPPLAVIDVVADRVDVGEPLRLSGARSRDDGQPRALRYAWRLGRGPFGTRPTFTADSVGVAYTPRRAGRYTFVLEVSDGEFTSETRRSVFARGELGYVLFPEQGLVQPIDLGDGAPVGDRISLGPLAEVSGFLARAGVLYVTAQQGDDAVLVIAEPGRAAVRRLLRADSTATAPAAAISGVWVPLHGTAELLFSDPTGAEPVQRIRLPQRLRRAFSLVVDGDRAWLSNPDQPAVVVELDGAGRVRRDALLGGERCALLHTVAADADFVYVGCRQRNAVARVRRGQSRNVAPEDVIDLPGGSAPRNMRVTLTRDHVVVRHRLTDYVSVVPTDRWALPADHPDRRRAAQAAVRIEDAVVDVAGRGRYFYALVNDAQGRVRVHAFEAGTGRRLWRRGLNGRRATYLAIDAADDFSRDLGEL